MGIPYKNLCSSLRKYVKIINAYISESVMYECDYVREWFDVHSYIHELMYPTQVCEREILHKCVQSVVCVCERVRVWVRGERSFSQKVLKLKGQRRQWSFRKAGEWDRGG